MLCLVDDMALCLSEERRCAREFKLLRILRIIAGWTLAFGVSLSVRWVPSEKTTSDGEICVERSHHVNAATTASHQVQSSPRVNSLVATTPSPPFSSPMRSERKNAKTRTSVGQCGGASTCIDKDTCSSSDYGNQEHEKASTGFDHSLRQDKGIRFGADALPGEGDGSAGRNPAWHEERTLPRIQHNVVGFRDAGKTVYGVQSCEGTIKTKIAAIP